MDRQTFHCGVQCIVAREDNSILLGLRSNTSCAGTWALPGGHLEHRETPIQCALRELSEETCLVASDCKMGQTFITYTTSTPYVHFPVIMNGVSGSPHIPRGEKFSTLQFFSLEALPASIFEPSEIALQQYRQAKASVSGIRGRRLRFKSDGARATVT